MGENQISLAEMPKFYNSIDIYICLSKSETGPNPCLEAGACAKPVISTRVGIVPQLIKHDYNGLLIPRNRRSLIESINYLQSNPTKIVEMGRNIRKTIEKKWSWKILSKNYERLFDFIISNQ